MIQYETQRLSLRFFVLMMIIFLAQVSLGLLLAAQHVNPNLLAGTYNFNVVRASHLNLGLLWIIAGFMGTIFFCAPLLSKRDLVAPWLIKFLFYAFIGVVIWNVIAQAFAMKGIAGWWASQPWFQEGLEYLEAGRLADVIILIAFGILAYVVHRTFPPVKEWNEIHWGLGIGVTALMVIWLFGLFYVPRLDLQEYFRWYVVHYWVEGIWEVIHISLIGYLLVLLFKADIKSVGYAVFWGVLLVWLSGLLGNAHHYFWIGTPEFWQFWGSLFSALEPVPLIFCFWHIYLDAHEKEEPLENAPVFYFILGSVVLEQVGAGILGFTMTFALTNVWSHGTWVTPAHGHLALFGTFGMLVIGAAYYAIPKIRNKPNFDQRIGKFAFWLLFMSMLGIAVAFAIGGTRQIYLTRILGLDWFGGDVNHSISVYKALLPIFGTMFLFGACLVAYDLITLGFHEQPRPQYTIQQRLTYWNKPLSGFEAGMWLTSMWVFGAIITLGLLSFNLDVVRTNGDPTLPYLCSWVGYFGLFTVTGLFVFRFLSSLEARTADGHIWSQPNPNIIQAASLEPAE